METTIIQKRESLLTLDALLKMALSLGFHLVLWWARTLSVTDKRVIWCEGVFNRSERSIPLSRVQDVSMRRNMFGHLFGYGTIRIESAGSLATEIVAKNINGPEQVKDAILTQMWN